MVNDINLDYLQARILLRMTNKQIMTLMKVIMAIGITFILIGVYGHFFSETLEEMGVTGMIISGAFVAIGMALSLPTKMFLTFIWVQHENEQRAKERKGAKS